MLFQQQGGLAQATGEDVGLEFNPKFFIGSSRRSRRRRRQRHGVPHAALRGRPGRDAARRRGEQAHPLRGALQGTNIFGAVPLPEAEFEAVKVDRLRPKAKVAIIGEFWAMTTEGDGNYHLQKFLESEGAENDIQLTTAWLLYNVWEVERDTRERRYLKRPTAGRSASRATTSSASHKRLAAMLRPPTGPCASVRVFRTTHRSVRLPPAGHGRDRRDRPALLHQRPARRRRPHGGRQAHLQRHARQGLT
jgi:hypothetical protein